MSARSSSTMKLNVGKEPLVDEPWRKMNTRVTMSDRLAEYVDQASKSVIGDLEGDDLLRVMWLSTTLFFIVGGYWLLRSLKDPIMSTISGVSSRIDLIRILI